MDDDGLCIGKGVFSAALGSVVMNLNGDIVGTVA